MNDRKYRVLLSLAALVAGMVQPGAAQNLIANGAFTHAGDRLKGWTVDYAWTGNEHFVDNKDRVRVVDREAGRSHVLRIDAEGDEVETRVESPLLPFDLSTRYRAALYVKGGPYRIYFSGYQWRPGIRPHAEPTLPELRQVYRSKNETGRHANWTRVTFEIPGVDPSPLALRHLQRVRFVTVYIYFRGSGFIDDLVVMRFPGDRAAAGGAWLSATP